MTLWETVLVANRWRVTMPEVRTEGMDWGNWERCRFDSMAARLQPGDVLYDIGAEWGEVSAAYAQIVGPENMVLVEPHPQVWTIIKAVWEANMYANPAGHCVALMSDETRTPEAYDYDGSDLNGWPKCAYGPIWKHRSFRYIHEHSQSTQQITLDDYAATTGVYPDAVTIDVEGYELTVLHGARDTLEHWRPLVWVSVHPDQMDAHCNHAPEQLHAYMESLGYVGQHLGTDHEEHWLFTADEGDE